MCNCISEFAPNLIKDYKHNGKTIVEAKLLNKSLSFKTGEVYVTGECEVLCEGEKKKRKVAVIYGFCPFCGQEYK